MFDSDSLNCGFVSIKTDYCLISFSSKLGKFRIFGKDWSLSVRINHKGLHLTIWSFPLYKNVQIFYFDLHINLIKCIVMIGHDI